MRRTRSRGVLGELPIADLAIERGGWGGARKDLGGMVGSDDNGVSGTANRGEDSRTGGEEVVRSVAGGRDHDGRERVAGRRVVGDGRGGGFRGDRLSTAGRSARGEEPHLAHFRVDDHTCAAARVHIGAGDLANVG